MWHLQLFACACVSNIFYRYFVVLNMTQKLLHTRKSCIPKFVAIVALLLMPLYLCHFELLLNPYKFCLQGAFQS